MRSRISLFLSLCVSLVLLPGTRSDDPELSRVDRIRIAEAFAIADQFGDNLWANWTTVPFPVLLVTPEYEYLIRHPQPSDDFTFLSHDSLLKSDIYFRPRQFPANLLATFPAVNGISTVVIGQAEHTDAKRSSNWVLTMLHEHFHQLQHHQPDYYQNTKDLNLSRGDQTAMWMLNFPFPYDSIDVYRQFDLVARRLRQTLLTSQPVFEVRLRRYLDLRSELKTMLSQDDYKYFSFQLWQEGVARYTMIALANLLAREYTPSEAFRSLEDYNSFQDEARSLRLNTIDRLQKLSLNEIRRSAFYPFGAAEALLLDRAGIQWKDLYFARPFYLEDYFPSR